LGYHPGAVDVRPFGLYTTEECSTLGTSLTDFTGRATRQLIAKQSFAVEKELWAGTLAQAQSYPNHYLGDGTATIIAGTHSPEDALAILEYNVGYYIDGQQALIHAPRNIVSLWNKAGALRREGSLIRTVNDTIVVPGSGYGQIYSGSVGRAYATDMMSVMLGPIHVIPDDESFARVDTDTNTITVRAERVAAIIWPGCANIGIQVTAPFDS
jgi:hypothetical protein